MKDKSRLGDIIRIALPLETDVYATEEALRQEVNWVSVIWTRNRVASQMEKGDILLLPCEVQQRATIQELLKFAEKAASLSAAAVILCDEIPEELLKWAESASLPLIRLKNSSLRDAHKEITSLLIDRQSQISERGMQLYRQLSEMSREGDSLQNMANLMGKLTGKIVVIQDKRLEIQALAYPAGAITLDEEALRNALMDKDNLPAVLRNRKAAAKANRTHWQHLLFPHHNAARLLSPIISGDRARGYLSIVGAAGEIDLLDTTTVEQGAAACALEMAKAKAVSEAKKALRGNFLEGLLAGTIPDREVERLAARLDHNTEQPHAVLTFRWRNSTNISVRRIETTLNWLLSTHNRPTLVHIYGDSHIVAFCALQDAEESIHAIKLARRLRDQLSADYPKEKLSAGLSGIMTTLTQWPQGYKDAMQAMEVGERLNLPEVVEFNSLGIYRLLGQLDDIVAVRDFCDEVIGPLVKYDRDHRSSLVLTIEQYFNHHGNVSQTAESLFVHRNTLLYRLDRIQDLTGHDLNQSDMRLALHLALKLWQLRPENN